MVKSPISIKDLGPGSWLKAILTRPVAAGFGAIWELWDSLLLVLAEIIWYKISHVPTIIDDFNPILDFDSHD
jgi:hypothetical protein